ncbi:Vi polysaccharide biosynthesis UDP-N-acetylglucosamine C-6 dehydrogenase TviB [Gammaproteobacteria bacterium]|nr:Vi polysaccharide biosynthesis UDP-N-acetylglucosamine C-6 dehydrogenase TviB [Gammaproteobacteria bacterium]
MKKMDNSKIAIVGLGYVGLPLSIEFGKVFNTIGFDTKKSRVAELKRSYDSSLEVAEEEFQKANMLQFTSDVNQIADCNIFIITVPTPIDEYKKPNLVPLITASQTVGKFLQKDDLVIYESTVYPGATEEVCIPLLEQFSGLQFNKDFFCGYSPERINPGDKTHTITMIKKVTSGSTPEIADKVDSLYQKIITAGTYKAASIKTAEAAKVIENTQRDVNIALVNELAIIFNKLGIDTESVLEAARTKWNFLPFVPGLVGGHCIGVDPYYLTTKALQVGYHPEMILAGRRINDNMGSYIADQVAKLMIKKGINLLNSHVLIMGLTFKENSTDLRNTGVASMIAEFKSFHCEVDVFDPKADKHEALEEYNIELVDKPAPGKYEAIVFAVAHDEFKRLSIETVKSYAAEKHLLYDAKLLFDKDEVDGRL